MKRLTLFPLLISILVLAACSSPSATAPVAEPTQGDEKLNLPAVESYPAVGAYPAVETPVESYPGPEQADPGIFSAYPPPYEAGKTTGVAAVDKVLAALPSSNAADVQALLVYASAPCTTAEGLGGPPKCKEGEAEGSQVEGIPVLGSEGSWTRKAEVPADFLAGPFNVLGVYEVNPDANTDPNYPAGTYAIVVTPASQPNSLILLRVDENGIVRVDYKMDGTSSGFSDASQFILPLQQ